MQITTITRNALMTAAIETGNVLDPAAVFVGVFASINNQGLQTQIGDLTAPPTSVAVRQPVTTWSAPYTLTDGRRVVDAPAKTFRPASSVDATVVAGWFIADALTAGNLLGFGLFPQPVPLPDENSAVTVVVRPTIDPAGNWDATITFNG